MRLLKSFLFCFCLASLSLSAAVLVNPQRAYVVNHENNTVSLISTSTDTLQDSPVFTGFNYPSEIAILPNGLKGYVTNMEGDSVSVIDFVNNTVDHTSLTGFDSPFALAVTPDGKKVYVISGASYTVMTAGDPISVIDVETNTVEHTNIDTNTFVSPMDIVISPDGQRAFISYRYEGVAVIDIKTNQVIEYLTAGFSEPSGIAITPDGTKVYVLNYADSSVSIIDTRTYEVDDTSLTSGFALPRNIAITLDGTKAYVTNQSSNILSIINLTNNTTTQKQISEDTYAVAISADGTKVYVSSAEDSANPGESSVDVLLVATDELIKTISGFTFPTSIGVVPIVSVVPEIIYTPVKAQKGMTLKWLLAQ
ncbi:MAG: hypothetical protein S4CHLAM37_00620 [Chlamydiia bacterium]|nr:hypothetical protein [Chlamydiia bacterium]